MSTRRWNESNGSEGTGIRHFRRKHPRKCSRVRGWEAVDFRGEQQLKPSEVKEPTWLASARQPRSCRTVIETDRSTGTRTAAVILIAHDRCTSASDRSGSGGIPREDAPRRSSALDRGADCFHCGTIIASWLIHAEIILFPRSLFSEISPVPVSYIPTPAVWLFLRAPIINRRCHCFRVGDVWPMGGR